MSTNEQTTVKEETSSALVVIQEKELENFKLKTDLELERLKSSMQLEMMNQKIEFLKMLHETTIVHMKERKQDREEAHQRELDLTKERNPYPGYPFSHHIPPGMGRFIGSTLLPTHLEHILIGWTGSSISNWSLVYRATTHGDIFK
jgi:hypothetical protein